MLKIVRRKLPARPTTPVGGDEEVENALFDGAFGYHPEVRKKVEEAYEGTTVTDDYNEVGFTYYLSDGLLKVKDKSNRELFSGVIASADEFEEVLKKVDRKIRRPRK